MKYIFVVLSFISGLSFAAGPSVQVEYQNELNTKTRVETDAIAYTVKYKVSDSFSIDGGGTTSQTDDAKLKVGQRLELGVAYEQPYAYIRLAVGEKFETGSRNSYYSIEPGVKFKYDAFGFKLAYRYRNAFNDATYNTQEENTYRVAAAYDITKVDVVGIGFDRTLGDSEKRVIKINYTRSF